MSIWFDTAKHCEDDFGVYVNYIEEFFMCPECDEPIYKDDYKNLKSMDVCPVCGFDFYEG